LAACSFLFSTVKSPHSPLVSYLAGHLGIYHLPRQQLPQKKKFPLRWRKSLINAGKWGEKSAELSG